MPKYVVQMGKEGSSETYQILDKTARQAVANEATARQQAIGAGDAAVLAQIAPVFAAGTAYTAGQYVTYEGVVYRLTADHAAGQTWANTQKAATNLGQETSDLNRALNRPSTEANFNALALFNSAEIPEGSLKSLGSPLECTVVSGKAWSISKTTTDNSAYKYADYTFPASYEYGFFVITGHSWSDVYPLISFYDSNDNYLSCIGERNNRDYTNYVTSIPKGAVRAVVNGVSTGEIAVYALGLNFIDIMANKLSPYGKLVDQSFITNNPAYSQLRNWPTNYIYSLASDVYTSISDIPSDINSAATITKFNPNMNRTSNGYSMYIATSARKIWYGFDTGSEIKWHRLVLSDDTIPSASVSVGFENMTPTQTVLGKAKHNNGSETSGTDYLYSEFAVTAGDDIYISGYHYANGYPLYIIYAGNTRLDYSQLGNTGKTYYRYKITVPKSATKIIVNGLANTGPEVNNNYGYPTIQKADSENLLSTKQKRRYLFIGDSYCEGYSHDGRNSGWAQYCAEYMGLETSEYVRSYYGGARFSANNSNNTYLARLKLMQYPFDYFTDIVVCGGYNDNSYTAEQIMTGIQNFVTMAKRMFPNAQIHIGFVAWNKAGNGDGAIENWQEIHTKLINTVLPAYQRCVEYGVSYMPNVEYWINDALITDSDGYHPGEAGNRSIARAVANALLTGSAPLPYNEDSRLD